MEKAREKPSGVISNAGISAMQRDGNAGYGVIHYFGPVMTGEKSLHCVRKSEVTVTYVK